MPQPIVRKLRITGAFTNEVRLERLFATPERAQAHAATRTKHPIQWRVCKKAIVGNSVEGEKFEITRHLIY